MRTLKDVEKDIYKLVAEANDIILSEKNENVSFRMFSYLLELKIGLKAFFVNCDKVRDIDGILFNCPVCNSPNTRKDYDFPTTMRCCKVCGSDWNIDDDVVLNGKEVL